MDIVKLMDLSFLTSKEQAIIQEVLKRDANLKKHEKQRIKKMRMKTLDYRSMKLQTGEWFEDLKAKRFTEYSSATDLLQYIFHQDPKSGFLQSRKTSYLTKLKNFKFLQKMFTASTITADLARSCSADEKNFVFKEECSPSPGADEQLSITEILKDLEFILDLEIQNSSSNAEIADINGFSPENVMVDKKLPADYSSYQVWHYPGPINIDKSKNKKTSSGSNSPGSPSKSGLLNLETLQTSLSPVKNAKMGSGKGLAANEYNYSNEVSVEDVQLCHKQIYQHA